MAYINIYKYKYNCALRLGKKNPCFMRISSLKLSQFYQRTITVLHLETILKLSENDSFLRTITVLHLKNGPKDHYKMMVFANYHKFTPKKHFKKQKRIIKLTHLLIVCDN